MKQPRLKTIEWDGKQIEKPGMYSKIAMETYHSADLCVGPSVSSGGLRRIMQLSPAHFYATWPGNPNCLPRKDTQALILGRAAHHLFLGEMYFYKLFAEQPTECIDEKTGEVVPWHNNRKFCREWHAARKREGRAVLTSDDVIALRGMADALTRHSWTDPKKKKGPRILNGLIERSLIWQDKSTGIWCKARPDSIPTDSGDFVDLKTTESVLWRDLQRTIAQYGYHQQGAFICQGAREVLGLEQTTFTLVFVEKEPPYCIRIVSLKDEDLARGAKQNRAGLDAVARCLESAHWPGPGGEREDAVFIDLPTWARSSIDDKLEFEVS